MELKKVISLPKTNWRKTLLWAQVIDVDYWLQYAHENGDPKTERWYDANNFMIPVNIAIRAWDDNYRNNEDSDYKVTEDMKNNAINFSKEFTELYGKINADILLAYLTQEA